MSQQTPTPIYQRIYLLVRQIPAGYVTTYGQLGRLVGCSARTVGFALAALPPGNDTPWQRVINSKGQVSTRTDGEGNILQYDLLVAEGLHFDAGQRLDLQRYQWNFLRC
ncbi:MAG: MGMT family protein [Gammaproteobacteria bacterium]|nr:MGMT family protein [Gammaproteobacteria bacterium]